MNTEELFDVLNNKVEPMILEAKKEAANGAEWKPPADWKRPFVETSTAKPVSIPASQVKIVEFMEEDESMGEFISTFLGPAPNQYLESLAVDVMGSYLTYSATSPLLKEFVEIAEPKATSISMFSDARVNHSELAVYVGDVPAKYLTEMPKLFLEKLEKIAKQEGIDMDRMRTILRREKRQMLNRMETSVSSVLADTVIQGEFCLRAIALTVDFLYGEKNGKELPEAFDDLKGFATLETWTAEQWAALLDKYYVSNPSITTIGKPSAKLSHELEETEKKRIEEQRKALGEEGLKKHQEKLDWAKKESDKEIPSEMLTQFPPVNVRPLTRTMLTSAQGFEVDPS